MGGPGSGGFRIGTPRTRVESCFVLDVNRLARDHLFIGQPRLKRFGCEWLRGTAAFNVQSCKMALVYSHRGRNIKQDIEVSSTACNYGGRRYWFVCPTCDRRAANLYLPWLHSRPDAPCYFACRLCLGLAYTSHQDNDPLERSKQKVKRRWKKLYRPSDADASPSKPKHMHWRTYDRLLSDYLEAQDSFNRALIEDIITRFPDVLETVRAKGSPHEILE